MILCSRASLEMEATVYVSIFADMHMCVLEMKCFELDNDHKKQVCANVINLQSLSKRGHKLRETGRDK